MHAKIQWLDNVHFEATSGSGHRIIIDGPPDSGGQNKGMRPMEMMLLGLGGCTSFDVMNILRKSRQNVSDCVTQLTAERNDEVPQVFTDIHIHFVVTGQNLDEKKVARAISLSAEKYCSASIMLERAGVNITHDFELIEVP
ncbi:MAG: OsmC family protein [Proteobacteria bacterium]|nr:OsmC family protein [Pseudomonadota bacterium]